MAQSLSDKKIAILATDGVEQVELTEPRKALENAGALVELVSIKEREITGWNFSNWGDVFPVDRMVTDVSAADYDAVLLPGGVMNPDYLRVNQDAVNFVKQFFDEGKPIAAICHGPWTLIEADAVRGRRITSWPSLKTDLKNAGAEWVDEEVVTDQGLVTSRRPDDIPAFNRKMIEEFGEGVHSR